jgi:hypothetical protein
MGVIMGGCYANLTILGTRARGMSEFMVTG